MLIVGYRGNPQASALITIFTKFGEMNPKEAKETVDRILKGETVRLASNWLLEEELKSANIIVGR